MKWALNPSLPKAKKKKKSTNNYLPIIETGGFSFNHISLQAHPAFSTACQLTSAKIKYVTIKSKLHILSRGGEPLGLTLFENLQSILERVHF